MWVVGTDYYCRFWVIISRSICDFVFPRPKFIIPGTRTWCNCDDEKEMSRNYGVLKYITKTNEQKNEPRGESGEWTKMANEWMNVAKGNYVEVSPAVSRTFPISSPLRQECQCSIIGRMRLSFRYSVRINAWKFPKARVPPIKAQSIRRLSS